MTAWFHGTGSVNASVTEDRDSAAEKVREFRTRGAVRPASSTLDLPVGGTAIAHVGAGV